MHNLALSLQKAGHIVTGSDDEIYDPARSRLQASNLLPDKVGWFAEQITTDIDLVILGMHAKAGNPELSRAMDLGIRVVSFPAFVRDQSKDKKRVVVAGSHGKTTTTSMILHVLKYHKYEFDYLVGAQLDNFDLMVSLSSAPLIVIEGDEYLSSAIDRIPKIWHYKPHISIITGVEWDHMNVFPTLEKYHEAFTGYVESLADDAILFFDAEDPFLNSLSQRYSDVVRMIGYGPLKHTVNNHTTTIELGNCQTSLQIFGEHNMKNLCAAFLVLQELGITEDEFCEAISSFNGAAKRLQVRRKCNNHIILQDFAHSPSKVRATVCAVKNQYPDRRLVACVELHTYSSLNKVFLPQYRGALDAADFAVVFYSPHTLEMKDMPPIHPSEILSAFGRDSIKVITESEELVRYLEGLQWQETNLLLMSSGTFGGLNYKELKTL